MEVGEKEGLREGTICWKGRRRSYGRGSRFGKRCSGGAFEGEKEGFKEGEEEGELVG